MGTAQSYSLEKNQYVGDVVFSNNLTYRWNGKKYELESETAGKS